MYICVNSFRCTAKANHSAEDTPLLPTSHNLTTVAPPCLSRSVTAQLVFQHGSFYLTFGTIHNSQFAWFSPDTFHSPVSILTLTLQCDTINTVHATQSHVLQSRSVKHLSVCLYNINKEPNQKLGRFVSRKPWIFSWV
jgi:hypothetical protein